MICDFCGNVSENKRAVSLYMRAARITYIDCPECGCALSMGEIRAAVRNYNEQFEEKRVRWITIHGRHIPMREKDAAGGGGSVKAGLTTGGGSGIINNKINTTYNSSNVNLTYHAIEQAISRNVSIDDMIDAIDNGLLDRSIKIDCNGRRSFQRIGRRATVAIDPDNNNVTSAWPTSTKRRNRLLKALQEGQYEESEIHARTNQVTSKFRPPNSH